MRVMALLMIFAPLPMAVFGIDVYIAPILYVDETEDYDSDTIMVQTDLLSVLWEVETGTVLQFGRLRDNRINPPQSLTEVVAVCRDEQIEYLLYGYVTRNAHSLRMEVRMFDYAGRNVLQSFFAMDDSSNYNRLIQNIAEKIVVFIGETFNLEIVPDRPGITRVLIPASAGYWIPMSENWFNVVTGIFVVGSGVEFIPTDRLFLIRGKAYYLSTGLDIKYRFGLGDPNRYDASYHTLYITLPVKLNVTLARQHHLFMGAGFVYFLEIFSITEKYDESHRYIFNNIGFNLNIGYKFSLTDRLSIFFKNDFDFLVNENWLVTYSPAIGVNFQVYAREVKKKW